MDYFIFASERTGSSYMMDWFSCYLQTHHGYGLQADELFNMNFNFRLDHLGTICPAAPTAPYASAVHRRQWLLESKHPVLLKHFPVFNNPKADALLFNHRFPICLYRQNRWEQILSYALSKITMIHNRRPNVHYDPANIVYDRYLFDSIVTQIALYDERVAKLPTKIEISYEEFMHDHASLLRRLELTPTEFACEMEISKLNLRNKEEVIVNLAEVRDWYAEVAERLHHA